MITGPRDRFRTVAGDLTGTGHAGKSPLVWAIQAALALYLLPVAAVVLAVGAAGMAFGVATQYLPARRPGGGRRRAARVHPHFATIGTTTPVGR